MDRIDKDELREAQQSEATREVREARARRRRYVRPPVDIYSTASEMVVVADMPGVQKGDLDITVERDELVIEAKAARRAAEESTLPWGYYRRFRLKTAFDRERISAGLEDGIVRITLPKAASEQARKVEVD
ncbi:MAG: Hsp20/alpha crystallin family protein [Gemmatimonadota bacterium]|nr:MAG: Hsp20/alpha crystallin family protein [Gemmatimonadota bacterium]